MTCLISSEEGICSPSGVRRRAVRWCGPGVLACLLASVVALSACRTAGAPPSAARTVASQGKRYHLEGIVVSTDASTGEVSVDSKPIPGFMDAMIMPYKLRRPATIGELHPGDHIAATLLVASGITLLDEVVITQQAQPDYRPAISYNTPRPGEPVPDFRLLNQSNKTIELNQFRGKVLLVTFIYTRCPLADYCPRMSRNFAEMDRDLATNPRLYRDTHLLSISFDPGYDTPAVLRSYGGAYTGNFTKERFAHWDFAAPPKDELEQMEKFFDVGVTPGANHTLTHSLSTVVIGRDGRIVAWYPTNDWSPADLLREVKKALGEPLG